MSNYTYSFSSQVSDMSSYVAVSGRPESNYCCVFGLTPQELRYLKGKFQFVRKNGETGHTQHGYRVEASPLVVLNALGFIGFKVIAVAGTHQEYLWTLERNLDSSPMPDITYTTPQARHSSMYDISANNLTLEVPRAGGGGSCTSLVSDPGSSPTHKKHYKGDKG